MMATSFTPHPTSSVSGDPRCEYTQEVRFAVVLYGGVSLSVYINGITQELLSLVRATAPATRATPRDLGVGVLDRNPAGTEAVYRRLGQLVTLGGVNPDAPTDRDHCGPVTTRFVVDILSGTSAGGINAIVLAKALANDATTIDQIRNLWICQADIGLLINDRSSVSGTNLTLEEPPVSLLNSERMYLRVFEALHKMDPASDLQPGKVQDSHLVDELDCWITATDLRGLVLPIKLDDEIVQEPRYKNVFRLIYRSAYSSGDAEDVTNHFLQEYNPFLAFAARCTSSFPFAFEPMQLGDIDECIARSEFAGAYPSAPSAEERYAKLIETYAKSNPSFRIRSFGDGGILDNRPFSWATATLARRRADIPVARHLLYLEPAPDPLVADVSARPDALETVAMSFNLPRRDSIREDIERIRERNDQLEWLVRATQVVDLVSPAELPLPEPDWSSKPLADLVVERGLQWASYHRLNVLQTLDDLSSLVVELLGATAASDTQVAMRALMQAWFERAYESDAVHAIPDAAAPPLRTQASFLLRFDLGFRLRRVFFLDDRIETFLRQSDNDLTTDIAALPGLGVADGWQPAFRSALRGLKPGLNDILVELRRLGRALRKPDGAQNAAVEAVRIAVGFGTLDDLTGIVLQGTRTPDQTLQRARIIAKKSGVVSVVTALTDAIAARAEGPLIDAAGQLGELLNAPPGPVGEQLALAVMTRYRDTFESYDAVLLPMARAGVGESGHVEIMRVSPSRARRLVDQATGRRKLAGTQFGHFGGFLAKSWRLNDMMWGRLDAAERLIDTIVPVESEFPDREEVVTKLVKEAHLAILQEVRSGLFPHSRVETSRICILTSAIVIASTSLWIRTN